MMELEGIAQHYGLGEWNTNFWKKEDNLSKGYNKESTLIIPYTLFSVHVKYMFFFSNIAGVSISRKTIWPVCESKSLTKID